MVNFFMAIMINTYKTKIKIYAGTMITNFQSKNSEKKKTMQVVNNTRFCYQSKEKSIILEHSWKNANINKKR